ncbi:MAG TPA: enoyl-CoA hydratase-related protein, partial [Pyrinomonadaceae bacterium]|nr:enoyl-CoA hydratase-related protein [Pyrinomonadaceae bacterium]
MTEPQVVTYSVEGAAARVTLNRPEKRNALNDAVIAGIKEGLGKAARDENVKVVVIAGAGKDFCSGADLSALQKIAGASVAENAE